MTNAPVRLGHFEQLVLLAVLQLGDTAYAPAILDEITAALQTLGYPRKPA